MLQRDPPPYQQAVYTTAYLKILGANKAKLAAYAVTAHDDST